MRGTESDAAVSPAIRRFSLFAGGPLCHFARRLGLVRDEPTLVRLGLALALLTWTPLAVLAGLAAVFGTTPAGVAVPFTESLGSHARFLVAIPLFFAAEAWIGPRLASFFRQIVESQLVLQEDLPLLDNILGGATRLRDSAVAEVLIVILTISLAAAGVRVDLPGDATTWRSVGGALTWAGWWYTVVSLPVFQFLLWRWCWRLLIWTIVLWRVSRMNLRLVPTHPDLCGGLGYLGVAQSHFGALAFATSAVLSASFAEQILFAGQDPRAFLTSIGGVVFGTLLLFLGPLLCFTPRLFAVKRHGLREYGLMAATYTRLFQAKWVSGRQGTDGELLGSSDIQSLADLSNSFAVVRNMRLVPFGPGLVFSLVVSALAPMAPLLFFQFSFEQLLLHLAKLVIG